MEICKSSAEQSASREARRTFVKILVVVFACEAAVMAILHVLVLKDVWTIVLDPILLAGLSTPVVYQLVVRPIRDSLEKCKRTEQALRESEDLYRQLVEGTENLVTKVDEKGRFIFVNPSTARVLGLEPDGYIGLSAFDFIHPEDRQRTQDWFEDCVRKRMSSGSIENRQVGRTGEVHDMIWTCRFKFDAAGRVIEVDGIARRITELKEAEKALQRVNEQLRTSIEKMPFGYILWDRDFRVLEWNRTAEKIFGYRKSEVLGTPAADRIVPEAARQGVSAVIKNLQDGEVASYSEKENNVRKDGKLITCQWHNTPLKDKAGEVFGVLSMAEDITARRQMEDELDEYRERLEELVRQRTEKLWSVNETLKGEVADRKKAEEALAEHHEQLEQTVRERTAELAAANESLRLEISERKQAQSDLAIFKWFIEAAGQALGMADLDGRITHANTALCRLLDENTQEDAIGKNIRYYYDEDSLETLENVVLPGVMSQGQWIGELRMCSSKGRVTPCIQAVFLIRDEEGEPQYLANVLTDISGQKQVEEELARHRDHLEEMVQERTAEMARLNEELRRDVIERKRAEEKLRQMEVQLAHVARVSTVGEMVAGIAHEVNQPLGSIRNFAQASSNVLAAEREVNLDDLREWNTAIGKAAAHAVEIVRRLRGFVRRTGLKRSTCSINEIAEEALQLVAFEADRQKAAVRLELSETSPLVRVDRVEIQQVLVNLLQNAYEAMKQMDPQIREVTLRTEVAGEFVEVSVADTGPGLSSEDDLQVFSAFVTTKQDGLGIGLAIATTIVEAHGGELSAAANCDGGATFLFTLPVAREGKNTHGR